MHKSMANTDIQLTGIKYYKRIVEAGMRDGFSIDFPLLMKIICNSEDNPRSKTVQELLRHKTLRYLFHILLSSFSS